MYILYPLTVQCDSAIFVDGVARKSLHAATNCVTEPAVEEACSQKRELLDFAVQLKLI